MRWAWNYQALALPDLNSMKHSAIMFTSLKKVWQKTLVGWGDGRKMTFLCPKYTTVRHEITKSWPNIFISNRSLRSTIKT